MCVIYKPHFKVILWNCSRVCVNNHLVLPHSTRSTLTCCIVETHHYDGSIFVLFYPSVIAFLITTMRLSHSSVFYLMNGWQKPKAEPRGVDVDIRVAELTSETLFYAVFFCGLASVLLQMLDLVLPFTMVTVL